MISRINEMKAHLKEIKHINAILTKKNGKISMGGWLCQEILKNDQVQMFFCDAISLAPAPPHKHDNISEHVVVVNGEGVIVMTEGKEIKVEKLGSITIAPNAVHAVVPLSTGTQVITLLIPPDPNFDMG